MRIFNGTDAEMSLPFIGSQRIDVPAKSVSQTFMPTNEFISVVITSYDIKDLAFIVSGPYEITMCANVSGATPYVVQSLDGAIERFSKKSGEEKKVEEKNPVKEEVKETTSVTETTVPVAEENEKKSTKKSSKKEAE